MTDKPASSDPQPAVIIIRHLTPWVPARHTPSFLQPFIKGVTRRLTAIVGANVNNKKTDM